MEVNLNYFNKEKNNVIFAWPGQESSELKCEVNDMSNYLARNCYEYTVIFDDVEN